MAQQQTPPPQRKHSAATARIQARLERLELAHLREVVAAQGDEIAHLVEDLHACENRTDYWRESHEHIRRHLNDGTADARTVGLTKEGDLLLITKDGAIDALRNRAVNGMLINATHPPEAAGDGFSFWQGYIKALQDLRNGAGDTLAAMDLVRSGYEPSSHLKAAFAALSVRAEAATFAEVQQLLAAQGVEVASQAVAQGQVNAGQKLEDGVVPVVNAHDEHAPVGVDGDDGALHGAAPCCVDPAMFAGSPIVVLPDDEARTISRRPAVIFSAPAGSGKTRHAQQLADDLGCTSIVEEWAPTSPLQPGALHLTNCPPSTIAKHHAIDGVRVHLVTRGWLRGAA